MRISQSVKKLLFTAGGALVIIVICLAFYRAEQKKRMSPEDYPLNVYFFDVGEGDCELIRCEGYNVLIDGGEAEYGRMTELNLRASGVETIDCYILTHPHSDHIGAAAHIISTFSVAQVMTTAFSELNTPTTKAYEDMLACADAYGAELLYVGGGETYSFGPLRLDILSPLADTDDYNDMSVTVRAVYKGSSFLFMGDASAAVEAQLLDAGCDLRADVLKIGHHGSGTSTSEPFLNAVDPAYAVISCGAGNAYGHPHAQTLNLLAKHETEVFRTDLDGTIQFYGSGRRLAVRTAL